MKRSLARVAQRRIKPEVSSHSGSNRRNHLFMKDFFAKRTSSLLLKPLLTGQSQLLCRKSAAIARQDTWVLTEFHRKFWQATFKTVEIASLKTDWRKGYATA